MTFSAVTCLCLALFAGVYADDDANARIIGGTSTTIETFPFQVSLRSNGRHFCGGSIIGQRHILTAAHCLFNGPAASSITVVTGSTMSVGTTGRAYRVSRLNIHPGYTGNPRDNFHNDIAVITVSSPISFDKSTQQVQLPSRQTQAGETVTISGWGIQNQAYPTTASVLQKAATTVVPNSSCSSSLTQARVGSVSAEQICTYQRVGVGACNGDSGGPLSSNNQVVGVVSFGIPCAKGFPDVFTRVYSYKSWIQNIVAST